MSRRNARKAQAASPLKSRKKSINAAIRLPARITRTKSIRFGCMNGRQANTVRIARLGIRSRWSFEPGGMLFVTVGGSYGLLSGGMMD